MLQGMDSSLDALNKPLWRGDAVGAASATPGSLRTELEAAFSRQAAVNQFLAHTSVLSSVLSIDELNESRHTITELEDSLADHSMILDELNTTVEELHTQVEVHEAHEQALASALSQHQSQLAAMEATLAAQAAALVAVERTKVRKDMLLDGAVTVAGLWGVNMTLFTLPLNIVVGILPISARAGAWLVQAVKLVVLVAFVRTVRSKAMAAGLHNGAGTFSAYAVQGLRLLVRWIKSLLAKAAAAPAIIATSS
ncbi:uncharacterized protein AMSG_03283 [Thecamonas trahens ATCC 50062]|uniref:Uncharacterized protein n=1 Tax=Thecamonas trahens ATCC 50062 TaxID=461836 RepID=A0A0L0D6B1_THETB|nr:hypothetical protein AMSG_03283 [Thecamonas trahens ATCC 50062]KNC46853.1 hypothetical protein AMSG_03283 [Thecamonas trahens ATCC 50062]|eukprot:XP_013760126.1 hypothetical protein AMSG_03283 [Thecamonas trahens ATCC 50062]